MKALAACGVERSGSSVWRRLGRSLLCDYAHSGSSRLQRAGISKPREQISLVEVHDCFSVTELVTMEDLQLSPEGGASCDVLDGFYDASGKLPCQIDGGLKCFGHPIGASGLRMIYEMYLQLQGRADERQRGGPVFGMTHNLGGFPSQNVLRRSRSWDSTAPEASSGHA